MTAQIAAMRITVEIDDALMQEAMEVSGLPTKRATIEAALRFLIRTERRAQLCKLRGIGWEGDLDEMRT